MYRNLLSLMDSLFLFLVLGYQLQEIGITRIKLDESERLYWYVYPFI